jgi:oligopeptide transport system substrate-binding protein
MKKILSLILVIVLVASLFTACGSKGPAGNLITINLAEEPKTIDPTLNSSVDGGTYINHLFEGLTTVDKNLQTVPGVAEKWDVSSDGTVYTFHIRSNAKWSDGKAVTAKDFVYSWKRAVDPATASEYAYQLYYVKNAAKINGGEGTVEDLGVKAIDDKTLEVTLEGPCAYFLQLTSFPTLYPLREDIITANPEGWTQDPKTYIGNGPFKMKEWVHDSNITLVKNENYWNAKTIVGNELKFVLMADDNTIYSAFQNGELLFADTLPASEIEKTTADGTLSIKAQLGTYFYVFNTQKAPFDNAKVRKALTLAIDRQFIVTDITKANQIPAGAFVPTALPDAKPGEDFRLNGKDYYDPSGAAYEKNLAEAKQLLADAGYPDGKGFPTVEFGTNDTQGHIDIAQAVQQMWEKGLGIKVNISSQEWSVFQQSRRDGAFDVARHGWLGDYVDPMTFLDMWTSTSGQNDSFFKNSEFDKLIEEGRTEGDNTKRMAALHKAEDILIGQEYAVLPIYYYSDLYLTSPKLKNVVYSPLGFKYFMWATLEK